jgi:hypothetical protein
MPVKDQGSTSRRLAACDDGAIIAFGVFFSVLLVGLLYYLVGLGATMYYRERVQDAADASAFASAIVHARGMNTIALINVVMAAMLAVIVALRLTQALIIVAQVILYALSWLGGATAAIASALEVVRQAVVRIEDAVAPVVANVNKVLKIGGNVVRVVVPVGSNLSVLGKIADKYVPEVQAGVALPARLTLPVEDDKFDYLCNKAGVIAGGLALLPMKPIIPGGLRKRLQKALGTLAQKGSSWFCDGSDPPEYTADPEVNNYPATEAMGRCSQPSDDGREVNLAACFEAEEKEGRAQPFEDSGLCRAGEPVCQEMIDKEGYVDQNDPELDDGDDESNESIAPGTRVEYSKHSWCGSEVGQKAVITDDDCHRIFRADGSSYPDSQTPYGTRLADARVACDPKHGDRYDYWWMEREVEVAYEWNQTAEAWVETGTTEVVPETPQGRPASKREPCKDVELETYTELFGRNLVVKVDGEWHAKAKLDEPVCTVEAPKPKGPSQPSDPTTISLRRVEVTQVLGCSNQEKVGETIKPKALNLSGDNYTAGLKDLEADPGSVGGEYNEVTQDGIEDLADTGGSSESSDTTPFRFIPKHKLGTSDMQIRALSIGTRLGDDELGDEQVSKIAQKDIDGSLHHEALRVIAATRWGTGSSSNGLSRASETWGRFAVAQAEYFFAVQKQSTTLAEWGGTKWDEKGEEEMGRDFMWAMYWTARMRRFRMSFKVDGESADGEPTGESSGSSDSLARKLNLSSTIKGADDVLSDGPDISCSDLVPACSQLQSTLTSLDGIFIH